VVQLLHDVCVITGAAGAPGAPGRPGVRGVPGVFRTGLFVVNGGKTLRIITITINSLFQEQAHM